MNGFAAAAIIIGVFFVGGLMVGFLIVMALPALVGRRGSDRAGGRLGDGRGASSERGGRRHPGDRSGPGRPARPEPRPWPGTGPSSGDPDGEDGHADGDDDGPDGPPGIPWWRNAR